MPTRRPSLELDRRRFLALSGGGALAAALGVAAAPSAPVWASPRFGSNPFSLGVASGDPLPDSVVLWTRLAPEPLALDGYGGMPDRTVPVSWQVAEDPAFRQVVRASAERTTRELGHSVHADVRGLRPGRDYWYRFRVGSELSEVGRTRTAPAVGASMSSMSFAFASCQNYQTGYFTPYAHMAREDLDAVVFLGDYIYESAAPVKPQHMRERPHAPAVVAVSLADYRIRYGQYKSEPELQAAHAAFPWIVTMDDHEVSNNWWDDESPDQLARRANAFQAFWENLPLRTSSMPSGPDMALYRRLTYGNLATFNVLDTRQYRDQQVRACAAEERTAEGYCPEQLDPQRTILGADQERWLLDGLGSSTTSWNVLANQGFFTQRDRDFEPGLRNRDFNLEQWDGYVADRQTILDHLQARDIKNMVVTTGDSHKNWVLNTPPSYLDWDADTPPVATDFMVTSVTSGGERPLDQVYNPEPDTPHLLYRDASHGYAVAILTPDLWRTDYRSVSTVEVPQSDISTLTSWVVENGRPGALQA